MNCLDCELKPLAYFEGQGLCNYHAEQWIEVSTRHAPNVSGPPSPSERRSPQTGMASHVPRHYK
jgi:hypothetical protein